VKHISSQVTHTLFHYTTLFRAYQSAYQGNQKTAESHRIPPRAVQGEAQPESGGQNLPDRLYKCRKIIFVQHYGPKRYTGGGCAVCDTGPENTQAYTAVRVRVCHFGYGRFYSKPADDTGRKFQVDA